MTDKDLGLLPLTEAVPDRTAEGALGVDAWPLDQLDFDHEPGEPSAQFIENVRRAGVIVPIVIRHGQHVHERPRVLDGVRRCKAARLVGLTHVMATDADDLDPDVVTLITNNNRSPNPRTELAAIERLIKTTGATPKQLARELGIPYGTVKRRMKLRKLSGPARRRFEAGDIAIGVAERMSKLPKREQNRVLGETARDGVPITAEAISAVEQVGRAAAVAELGDVLTEGPTRADVRPAADLVSVLRADLKEAADLIETHLGSDPLVDRLRVAVNG